MAFVRARPHGGWEIDPNIKLHSLISNGIALEELARWFSRARGHRLLDLGCGARPFAPLYQPAFRRCFACDVPASPYGLAGVDFLARAAALPLRDASLDCVLCTEVLEHVPDPATALSEIARVLRGGGYLILTVPFLVELHEEPEDYYRYTSHGLVYLLGEAGFELERCVTKGDALAVMVSFVQWPLFKVCSALSAATGLRWLYSPRNPLLWALGMLPQRLCLAWYRFSRRRPVGLAARLYRRLDYVTLGYVVIARRRSAA
jgi:SAM-dependent methyltransferase